MSQFTYSQNPQKRSRTLSEMSSYTTRGVRSMLYAPSARTYVGPKREVGGAGVQRAGTKGAKKKKSVISFRQLMDQMYPRLRIKLLNYGFNFKDYSAYTGAAQLNNVGNLRMIRSYPTKQYWFESIGLPFYYPDFEKTVSGATATVRTYNQGVWCLEDLVNAARNNRGSYNYSEVTALPAAGTYSSSSAGFDNQDDRMVNMKFHYEGGYQKHTFVNSGSSQAFLEVYECHPRNLMFDWEVIGSGTVNFRAVGDVVLRDFQDNNKYTSGSTIITDATDVAKFDSLDDILIGINSRCKTVHYLWKVSKPIKVTLAPGETFHYTMAFPGFSIDQAEWAGFLNSVDASTNNQVNVFRRPTSIPKFTKRLVVRAWGEVGHTTVDATTTTGGVTTTNVTQPGVVGNTPVALLHLQEEFHSCRHLPTGTTTATANIDKRDESVNAVLEVINDESDTMAAFDA